MNERRFGEDILRILGLLSSGDDLTQRDLSYHLGVSLGKINYMLKSLVKIGLLEIKNFTIRDQKIKKVKYLLTKHGMGERLRLSYHFLKQKEAEYSLMKKEWEHLKNHATTELIQKDE